MAHDCDVPLKEQIKDIAGDILAARADGKITFREGCGIVSEILHAGSHVAAAAADPVAILPQLIDAAEAAYDEFIEPLDLVGVPNTIEPFVDGWLRGQIRPGLTALVSSFGS